MRQSGHWSGTGQLRGGRWGIWFFITALRVLGLRVTYALAIPVAVYFSFASPDVAATMDFHRRIYGRVPWWKPESADVTLHQILVHLIAETHRHAGHADILRELIDGATGR